MLPKPSTVDHLGKVIEVNSNNIKISITSNSACSACHAKGGCNMSETSDKVLEYNNISAHFSPGDQVKVILKQSLGLRAAFLAYVIPFLILIISLVVLKGIKLSDGLAGIISITVLVPYYLILYMFRNRLTKTFSFEVEKLNNI